MIPTTIVLVAAGRHPVSAHPCRDPGSARALELALRLGRPTFGLYFGAADEPSLAEYLGMGLTRIDVLDPRRPDGDAVAPLAAALRDAAPAVILAGDGAATGEGSGLVPYLLAERLGLPVLAGVVALTLEGGAPIATRARSPSRLHRFRLDGPAMLIAAPGAPPPRPVAFAEARRGTIAARPVAALPDGEAATWTRRPARARPRRIALGEAAGGGAGGRILTGLSAEAAARAIAEFLADNGVLATGIERERK